ncbi:unnamed protein product [Cylicostephanus goldi]|uniref:Uncharacterized protein n=1 Tax=Cylicostephanus goldi TaxID=71465 RepID=A0A3P6TBT5_CYLGO|nr:unnamed protein product [Cylicostephanus goldi]
MIVLDGVVDVVVVDVVVELLVIVSGLGPGTFSGGFGRKLGFCFFLHFLGFLLFVFADDFFLDDLFFRGFFADLFDLFDAFFFAFLFLCFLFFFFFDDIFEGVGSLGGCLGAWVVDVVTIVVVSALVVVNVFVSAVLVVVGWTVNFAASSLKLQPMK